MLILLCHPTVAVFSPCQTFLLVWPKLRPYCTLVIIEPAAVNDSMARHMDTTDAIISHTVAGALGARQNWCSALLRRCTLCLARRGMEGLGSLWAPTRLRL